MKVRFTYRPYRLPLRTAVRTAHGAWTEREGVIVRLEDEHGSSALGEACPIPWFGTETAAEVEIACRDLGEWGDAERLENLPTRLGCLRHAIDAAWRGLRDPATEAARATGHETSEKSEAAYLSVAALLPAGRAALAEVAAKAEAGFRVFKWKVGVADLADELGLLDDLCAELPDGAKLRLDANGTWNRRQAERWLERCAERPIEFLEQPIGLETRGVDDLLLGLAGDYPTPIALDESVVGEADLERWIGAGWPGVLVVKLSLLPDVASALARLQKANADVVFSSALETAVGARAALRSAFAWSGKRRALGFGVWPLFADARFDGPHLAPFVRREDVERLDGNAVWNALI